MSTRVAMRDAGLRGAILCREKRDHLRSTRRKSSVKATYQRPRRRRVSFHALHFRSSHQIASAFPLSLSLSRSATDTCFTRQSFDKRFAKIAAKRQRVPLFSSSKAIKSRRSFSRRAILFASFLSSFSSFFSASRAPFLGFFSRNEAASLAGRQPSYDTRLHQQTKSVKDIPLTGCLALSASGPFENDACLGTTFVSQARVISSRYLSQSSFHHFSSYLFSSSSSSSSLRIFLFT